MRRWSPLWVTIVLAVALGGGVLVWALNRASRQGPVQESPANLPMAARPGARTGQLPSNLDLHGPEITRRDDQGRPIWSARSKGSFRLDEPGRRLTGRDVVWHLKRGSQEATVSAGRMDVGVTNGEVAFADGLTVTAGTGQSFRLRQARVEPGTWKVIGQGGVRWIWGRFSVSADTLVVDTIREQVRLRGGVHLSAQ